MRNIKFKASVLALAAAMTLSGTAHASINGGSSNTDNVVVGTSNVDQGPHSSGLPGIAVQATGLDQLVDFAGLETEGTVDSSNVYEVYDPSGIDTDHTHLGLFHFAQVSGNDIYFGEWSQTTDTTGADHTVYYVGDDGGTTTVPTSGTATYSVNGISDYATNGLLSGTLSATFGSGTSGTLTGSLVSSKAGANSYTVNIGTANISGATFSGGGASASDSVHGTLASSGAVSGRFYGSNAAALAGLVNFTNAQYNTAFGGTKN